MTFRTPGIPATATVPLSEITTSGTVTPSPRACFVPAPAVVPTIATEPAPAPDSFSPVMPAPVNWMIVYIEPVPPVDLIPGTGNDHLESGHSRTEGDFVPVAEAVEPTTATEPEPACDSFSFAVPKPVA